MANAAMVSAGHVHDGHLDAGGLGAADPEVFDGVTASQATHPHTHGADHDRYSQLLYGPSSNFAFLRQLHRRLLLRVQPTVQSQASRVQHERDGLDLFVQRSVFFGTPYRQSVAGQVQPSQGDNVVTAAQATDFLHHFKTAAQHLLPLFTERELEEMLRRLYRDNTAIELAPHTRAPILAVLAIGALCASCTDLAEWLYQQAKLAASVFDEDVTLPMIQLPILLADYQINMGRPNSAYLHLGTASRKALAFGLHKEPIGESIDYEHLQKRRSTMYCLYFHERSV